MKPAYQATRDGAEAKDAHQKKGSTEPICAGSSVSLYNVLH